MGSRESDQAGSISRATSNSEGTDYPGQQNPLSRLDLMALGEGERGSGRKAIIGQ